VGGRRRPETRLHHPKLRGKPEEELDGISSEPEIGRASRVLAKIGRVSSTARSESAVRTGESLLKEWEQELSCDQISQMLDVVNGFGMEYTAGSRSVRLLG